MNPDASIPDLLLSTPDTRATHVRIATMARAMREYKINAADRRKVGLYLLEEQTVHLAAIERRNGEAEPPPVFREYSLLSRQSGYSTLLLARAFYHAMRTPAWSGKTVLVMTADKNSRDALAARVALFDTQRTGRRADRREYVTATGTRFLFSTGAAGIPHKSIMQEDPICLISTESAYYPKGLVYELLAMNARESFFGSCGLLFAGADAKERYKKSRDNDFLSLWIDANKRSPALRPLEIARFIPWFNVYPRPGQEPTPGVAMFPDEMDEDELALTRIGVKPGALWWRRAKIAAFGGRVGNDGNDVGAAMFRQEYPATPADIIGQEIVPNG